MLDRDGQRIPDDLKRPWPDIRPEDHAAVAAVLDRGILGGVGAPESTALENEVGGVRRALDRPPVQLRDGCHPCRALRHRA